MPCPCNNNISQERMDALYVNNNDEFDMADTDMIIDLCDCCQENASVAQCFNCGHASCYDHLSCIRIEHSRLTTSMDVTVFYKLELRCISCIDFTRHTIILDGLPPDFVFDSLNRSQSYTYLLPRRERSDDRSRSPYAQLRFVHD